LEIIDEIKKTLPEGSTLVFLAIVGGRAKGFTNDDSDYDTITIFLHPLKKYLLQDAKTNIEIKSTLKDGTKIQG
jgi:predicted nucleotidyltransferase